MGWILGLEIPLGEVFAAYGIALGVIFLFAAFQFPIFYKYGYEGTHGHLEYPFLSFGLALFDQQLCYFA